MKRPLLVFVALAAASGCGDDDSGSSTAATQPGTTTTTPAASSSTTPASTAKPTGKKIRAVSSQFGKVISDPKGEALYLFTKEKGSKSKCYGACADAWPPILTNGEPRAGSGVTQGKLGTTKRRGGKTQITYNGHPLYYYKDDSPGNILCQDVAEFGGTWYVVKPSGSAVT